MAPAPKFSLQQQETLVFDAAASCIDETSLLDFSMSEIAKRSGLSVGSVYKQVQSKADVIFALAVRSIRHQMEQASKIINLPLTTPEIVLAINLTDESKLKLYSFQTQLEPLIFHPAMLKKASSGWLEKMQREVNAAKAMFKQCFIDAANSGELQSGMQDVEELFISSWAFSCGYFNLVQQYNACDIGAEYLCHGSLPSADSPHIKGLIRLINAYPWQESLTIESVDKVIGHLESAGLR